MKVLSLFDGIGCGMLALKKAGARVDKYTAYEIDPYAVKICKHNFPEVEERGDVTTADFTEFSGVDLLIAGSPCQDLSQWKTSYAEGRQGLKGSKSELFYHFTRALKEAKPRYFFFENVASMDEESKAAITAELGVTPVYVNSACCTACERPRLYWTKISPYAFRSLLNLLHLPT